MLIRFKIGNFLSFDEVQEISMIAGKVQSMSNRVFKDKKIKLLKYAQIFGANASGKSNFVTAMDFFKTTVINKMPNGYSLKFNKCKKENKNKKSYFEIELKIDSKYYAYGFELLLDQGNISSEWLIEIDDQKEYTIFTRDVEKEKFEIDERIKDEELLSRLKIYLEDLDSKSLFLNIMNNNKNKMAKEYHDILPIINVYKWIDRQLDINYPQQPCSNYSYFMSETNAEKVVQAINAFSMGITNYKIVETSIESLANIIPTEIMNKLTADIETEIVKTSKSSLKNKASFVLRGGKQFYMINIEKGEIKCKTIQFRHESKDIFFSLSEESDGTVRILDLLEVLLNDDKKTYVIDEIDRCLHPQLTRKFIETYLELAKNRNIQLIVTTHESRLMDFDLVRRDEIWFVDKSNCGDSKIYSLEEYNTRFDQKIDKAYLDGRYGGVPIFNVVFPNLEKKNEN